MPEAPDDIVYSPVWNPDPRGWPPKIASEREILTSYLDWHRATFELKCTGVPPERVRPTSSGRRSTAPPGCRAQNGLTG
jgi:hypothetical protein